ncbi:ParB-like protein [Agrobacterium tumefaciens]|uniref:ParB-like protein n=1 Tax=Agrobacterium tumefaciens TaxID=358 RepID=UPI000F98BEC5|nr:ParB-like protein [Agrobacterium tumefaciens]NSX93550.1 chromosome partitioning protein ParB [Agrobacterium tumefaciens]UXT51036.1 chromosome partitioning protein ParB [Agrobacterium tumefaciens]
MPQPLEPHLSPIEITALRPTQMTVGLREVENKRKQWAAIRDEKGPDFLGHHMVPVVIGYKQRLYLVDHHHLALALHDEGVKHVLTSIVADLSHLGRQEFWSVMDHRSLVYPFNADGRRCPIDELPKRIVDLEDDPFRSLAGAVRDAGGFAKIEAPFTEFLWADFFRRRVSGKDLRHSFNETIEKAVELARSHEARHLPGWCGRAG